jgi:hypothetical protein
MTGHLEHEPLEPAAHSLDVALVDALLARIRGAGA